MRITGKLTVSTPSDREVMMTREFNAPRPLVYDAMTKPELLKRWLYGPDGWSLDVCEIDLRVGGAYRYEWLRASDGYRMGMGGFYKDILAPERIVTTEEFDEAWYPGQALITVLLSEHGSKTTLTMTILYDSKEARDSVLSSPMDEGLAMGYDRLETYFDSLEPAGV